MKKKKVKELAELAGVKPGKKKRAKGLGSHLEFIVYMDVDSKRSLSQEMYNADKKHQANKGNL